MTDQPGVEGIAIPDTWARLWAPHRLAYVSERQRPGCPFCRIPTEPDEQGHLVARGEHVYAVLNLFPYNPGHLMVIPYRHIAEYTELTDDETAETAQFTRRAISAIRSVSGAQGFNVGYNLGSAAGAGIAAHLHQHVVPRWVGDTNLMPVVAQTKVMPQLLGETRALIAQAWQSETS